MTRISGNSAIGRRLRDLYRAFLAGMGNPADVLQQSAALHAAELSVAVEQQRLRAARGDGVDIDALVRLANLADRAVRKLNLDCKGGSGAAAASAPPLAALLERRP